jgi:TPR repeat protein
MDNLLIQDTVKTPLIDFDYSTGIMLIKGRSIPQDAELFWEPILKWFYAYSSNPCSKTKFIFEFEYFNISSSKRVLFLLYKMAEMHENGHEILVQWICQEGDPDMVEVGNDYASIVNVPFEIVDAMQPNLVSL